MNGVDRISDIEGKIARVATSELGNERVSNLRNLRFFRYIFHIERRRMISILPFDQSDFDRADFFHGLLGAEICLADKEHDALNKLERVI